MSNSIGIIDGGSHTVQASWAKLADDNRGFNHITIRLYTGSSDIQIGVMTESGSVKQTFFLKADESRTYGPGTGTVKPSSIYIQGTADDTLWWEGAKV